MTGLLLYFGTAVLQDIVYLLHKSQVLVSICWRPEYIFCPCHRVMAEFSRLRCLPHSSHWSVLRSDSYFVWICCTSRLKASVKGQQQTVLILNNKKSSTCKQWLLFRVYCIFVMFDLSTQSYLKPKSPLEQESNQLREDSSLQTWRLILVFAQLSLCCRL